MSKAQKAEESSSTASVRIRHRDTGGVREIPEAQWRKEGEALRHEGYLLVDTNDAPLPDDTAAGADEKT